MADINIPIIGGYAQTVNTGDRLLTYSAYGVESLYVHARSGGIILATTMELTSGARATFKFPVIGKSLPCEFHVNYTQENTAIRLLPYYGKAIPDPDYFNIIGLDEEGLPIYADTVSEPNSIQLYKKPIINGNTLGDRVLLKVLDNTPENRMLYKIPVAVEIPEPVEIGKS